jgi:hypothetical protein
MIPVEHVVKRSDDVNKWHKRGSELGEAWSAPFLSGSLYAHLPVSSITNAKKRRKVKA